MATTACDEVELEADYVGAVVEDDSAATLEAVEKRQIYMSSVVNMSNFWTKDGLSTYAQELLQFLDAGYTRVGYDMYPP